NLEREVFMTHGYVDSHIIAQALRLRLKDETSVILSDLYLQILQYIEMHKTTLTDIIINDREFVLS
ncbi:protein YmgC, partial [Escherichia coli]